VKKDKKPKLQFSLSDTVSERETRERRIGRLVSVVVRKVPACDFR
jgi:hypothetical protein